MRKPSYVLYTQRLMIWYIHLISLAATQLNVGLVVYARIYSVPHQHSWPPQVLQQDHRPLLAILRLYDTKSTSFCKLNLNPRGSKYPIIIYFPKICTKMLLPKSQVLNYWVHGPLGNLNVCMGWMPSCRAN